MCLPTPGVRDTSRARRVRPQHKPQGHAHDRAEAHLSWRDGRDEGILTIQRVSKSCPLAEGLRAHNLLKWQLGESVWHTA